MRRVPRSTAGDVRMEMTPLIDVIFLLLTFFIFALTIMVRADTLDIDLPSLSAAEQARAGEAITVTLTEEGAIRVDGEEVAGGSDGQAWIERVRLLLDDRPGAGIALIADENGRVGDLAALFNGLTEAGIDADVGLFSQPGEAQRP